MALNTQDQIKMCGETFVQLEEGLNDCLGHKMMYVMGFLSDAQHMITHGDTEGARQILNGAKYLMSVMMEADLNKVSR